MSIAVQLINIRVENEANIILKEVGINFADVIKYFWDLNEHTRNNYPLLKGIDPYGDTLFNSHQFFDLKVELENLRDSIVKENKNIFSTIKCLVNTIDNYKNERVFIRFIGD